jgi:4-amino-4-deoxy-L-arabinose transferase-like glycosyltransferase
MTQTTRRSVPNQDWFYTLTLSVLAALPRLYRLDLAEFKLDEANHYRMAYFLTRGAWRWVGSTSSVGFPKPPLFIYTLALPLTLSPDPRLAVGFLGILAALAAGVFYLVLRRYLGKPAAFGAALLFAFNPQAVLYARKFFTADLLPPLCVLFLAVGLAFLESPSQRIGRLATSTTLTFALLLLTTFSPLVLLPTLGLLLWDRRRDMRRRHWLGAGAALVLPFLPYLAAVLPRIPDALAGTDGVTSSTGPLLLLNWTWELLSGSPWPEDVFSIPGIAALALALLSLAGLLFLLDQARKKESGHWARFFLSWLCLSPLLMLVVPIEIHAQYLVILYPLLFVLPAAGMELITRRSNLAGWGVLVLLGITAIWQAQTWTGILHAAAAGVEGYGTPLGYWWRATELASALSEREGAKEVLLLMPGDRSWDERANGLDALLSDTPHRVVNGHTTLVYPPHPAIFLIAPEVEAAAALTFPCTQPLADLTASPSGGAYHYRLWSPAHADASQCTQALSPVDARWASGARLLGYSVTGTAEPGATLHITLHLETPQGQPDTNVHWFNHLEDQAGGRWGQFDHVGWPAARWQPGDQVLLHYDLSIAPDAASGPYVLRVGQYTYPEITNIPILDAAGNPADYAVTLPVPAQ